MRKENLGRRALVLGLLRSPLTWAIVAIAAALALGSLHEAGAGVMVMLAWAGLVLLVVAGLPMALGFALQWLMPATRTAPVFGLLAVVIVGALQLSTGVRALATGHLSTWVSWGLAALSVFLLFSFLTAGAKACRRRFPGRFPSN